MPARRALLLAALPTAAFGQRRSGSTKPPPLDLKLPAPEPPPKSATGSTSLDRSDAAPVPNRNYEGPVVVAPADGPTLAPSVIQRRLPSRGQAVEGSPSQTEDRLFEPAPGARLTVPFRY